MATYVSTEKAKNSRSKIWILFVCVCGLTAFYFLFVKSTTHPLPSSSHVIQSNQLNSPSGAKFLDNCQYIYIDMGTNIGVQIRKLYEPFLYPKAQVLPLFQEVFGNHPNEVCSIGFEANPLHDSYLKEFESYCLKRRWRVKIYSSTAVSIVAANLTFFTEPGNEGNNQWGASLENIAYSKKKNITVPSIDIISWFRSNVIERKYSEDLSTKIMMKSDLEGHDQVVLTAMILSGIYCSIDLIYGEHLSGEFQNTIGYLLKNSKTCRTKLIYMDDESYHRDRFPFKGAVATPQIFNSIGSFERAHFFTYILKFLGSLDLPFS